MEKPHTPSVNDLLMYIAAPNFFFSIFTVMSIAAPKMEFLSVIGSPDHRAFSVYVMVMCFILNIYK